MARALLVRTILVDSRHLLQPVHRAAALVLRDMPRHLDDLVDWRLVTLRGVIASALPRLTLIGLACTRHVSLHSLLPRAPSVLQFQLVSASLSNYPYYSTFLVLRQLIT